jgi:hypothetical protein
LPTWVSNNNSGGDDMQSLMTKPLLYLEEEPLDPTVDRPALKDSIPDPFKPLPPLSYPYMGSTNTHYKTIWPLSHNARVEDFSSGAQVNHLLNKRNAAPEPAPGYRGEKQLSLYEGLTDLLTDSLKTTFWGRKTE